MSVLIEETVIPADPAASAVKWGPIFAGALAAIVVTLILALACSALGLTMVSPWPGQSASLASFTAASAIGLVVMQWLSAAFGGYVAGRLRTRWTGIHTDEAFFRDTAHGFLAWALATVAVALFAGSILGSALNSGVQAASNVVSGAASAATTAAADAAGDTDARMYFVDALFRPATPPATAGVAGAPPANDQAAAAEASRILIAGAASGQISDEDKAYLAQLVSARTGLTQADAQARVDQVLARVDEAKTKAQEAADAARKAGAGAAFAGAISLLVGAFIACAAAMLGGRQRDEHELNNLAA